MNPIALLAFIAGIGTGDPSPKHTGSEQEAQMVKEKTPKPQPPPNVAKRGGWDHN